jgi:hypothetical protein
MSVIHIIGVIVVIIGLVWLIVTGWNNIIYNTRKFGQTQGLLTRLGVKPKNSAARQAVNENPFVTNPQDIPLNADPSARYLPVVEYAYTVGGIAYKSDNLVFQGKGSYTAGETRAMLSQLTLGQAVTVLYNVNRPSESYLFMGKFNGKDYIAAIVTLVIGAIIIGLSSKSSKKTRSNDDIDLRDVDTPQDQISRYR